MQEDARDLVEMNHFLNQLDNACQLQANEAVPATLEVKSFARPKAAGVAQIKQSSDPMASVTKDSSNTLTSMMK